MTRAWLSTRADHKQRKLVDRKASKGRKLRFTVHDKLVNFMPPIDKELPTYVDDLFANMFAH